MSGHWLRQGLQQLQALRANPALSRVKMYWLAELGRLNAQHIPVALRCHVRQRGA